MEVDGHQGVEGSGGRSLGLRTVRLKARGVYDGRSRERGKTQAETERKRSRELPLAIAKVGSGIEVIRMEITHATTKKALSGT
ncbi:hypothetical protein ACFX14_045857 [Malus domestica]